MTKEQAVLNTLAEQRNQAMNVVAELNGLLAEKNAEIEALKAQLKPAE